MSLPILQIKNVTKIYVDGDRHVHALRGVDLSINQGEILSLLGVNGAGKTTLSSIIATLHPLTSGSILYNGTSIYDNLLGYRRVLGFCPQHPNLDPYLNVEENLLFAGRYFLMPYAQVKERTEFLLKQFGLEKYRTFKVDQLSGGYKQRLLIARAIIHMPEILLLDEPTVGLDPNIRIDLWEIIKGLKQQGMTIILTTHYLEESEILSDRVCMLSKGKVILTATVKDLKDQHKKESLEEIFLALVAHEEQEQNNGK